MINEKEKTLKTVYTLPNEISDKLYVQYMKEILKESEEQFKNGKFITLEEFEKEMESKYENSHVRYGKTEHK